MVNVPPIPPLLCSTPPPIDFGDEDDDIDILPHTMGGTPEEDEYGDYLVADNSKSVESLPSPRPPSVSDLPPVGIYDSSIPADELFRNHVNITSPQDEIATDITSQETTTNSTSLKPSTPIIEAFNHSITKQEPREVEKYPIEDDTRTSMSEQNIALEAKGEDQIHHNVKEKNMENGYEGKTLTNVIKVMDEVSQESQSQAIPMENKMESFKNMVSIEDLEDDLSEDELYSPKTPKNFTEIQDMNNFFAIHEIKQKSDSTDKTKDEKEETEHSDENNTKTSDLKIDNITSFKEFKGPAFAPVDYEMPPPLEDELNTANEEDCDDFGDFADFQEFSSASPQVYTPTTNNNIVPVNDYKPDQYDESRINSESNETLEFPKTQRSMENESSMESINQTAFNNFASADVCHEVLSERCQQMEKDASNSAGSKGVEEYQENLNDSFGDFIEAETIQSDHDNEYEEEMIGELSKDANEQHDNYDDDDFGDFADFEQHQAKAEHVEAPVVPKTVVSEKNLSDNDNDEDDDFGDFNTAEPLPPTTVQSTQTSQPVLKQAPSTSISMPTAANITERISKIVHIMFTHPDSPTSTPNEPSSEPKTAKLQEIPFTSIDAAKALEYQWLNSETRHSFIKSLGIDSRNILYGENWNPSLPRFAANLSFNPLKPMKPVTTSSSAADTKSLCPTVEPVFVNTQSDNIKPLTNNLGTKGDVNTELDWKTLSALTSAAEQTIEALNNNTLGPDVTIPIATAPMATSVPYLATEISDSYTPAENHLENEEQFSKTPPISEMESVNEFSLPTSPPIPSLEIDLPTSATPVINDSTRISELDEVSQDTLEVVVTSTTFAGSFKETHIYTPPKSNENSSSSTSSTSTTSPSKAASIDFDYEKAAMGVIIDEMVVKKEYRDIEYNSPFSMDITIKPTTASTTFANNGPQANSPNNVLSPEDDEYTDEFSDFQSVSSEPVNAVQIAKSNVTPILPSSINPSPVVSEVAKQASVSACGMILSPAILIPQAMSMESQKPKIEWGDSTTSINPEELARIEELFPEPKSVKSNNSNSSQKSTPTHQANPIMVTTPSISAAVANKELEANNDDDDDWSEFVSVPVTNNNKITTNNNVAMQKSPYSSPFKQRTPAQSLKTTQHHQFNNSNNDDEWSDFVSSAPTTAASHAPSSNPQQGTAYRAMPQFNSGAWQNANFYNNPLSLYHKGPLNVNFAANQTNAPKNYIQNNNNNYTQYNQFQMSGPQQIHIMQNFSTAPVPTSERNAAASSLKNNQFQVGSAKVAPSIALIPDLGFVAPAVPTHTSFINSLPKPSINTKK